MFPMKSAPPASTVCTPTAKVKDATAIADSTSRRARSTMRWTGAANVADVQSAETATAMKGMVTTMTTKDRCEGEFPCWRNPDTGYMEYCAKHEAIIADRAYELGPKCSQCGAPVPAGFSGRCGEPCL